MYRVGVIGLGNIAARYSTPDDPYPYCHVGGIRLCKATQLVAVADLSKERREEFAKTWGPAFPEGSIRSYESEIQMFENETLDIVAVCVRGPWHFPVMKNVLRAEVRAIFLEKPMGCSLAEVDEMTAVANAKGIPIILDYSRHWGPHLLRLQELVKNGLVGEVQSVIGYCGGGVLSFAIHTTDMICQFAGYDPISVSGTVEGGGEAPSPYESEPAIVSAQIAHRSGVQSFHVGRHGKAPAFAVDVLGTEGQLRAGFYCETFFRDKDGKRVDNATLGLPPHESVFKVAYEQIAAYLDGGPLPHCSGKDYLAVNEIGFATIESAHTGKRIEIPSSHRTRLIYANG